MKRFFLNQNISERAESLCLHPAKHTIKNYVLNELKRYIKYNSEKLGFLKLWNKFFDRLRNQGFRKYSLTKKFSAVSYASRNKYLSTNDKIYSTVMQETQAEMALNEVAESIFQDHLQPDQNTQEKEVGASIKERTISPTDKVVYFQTTLGQKTKPKKRFLSWFCFSRKLCTNTQRNQEDFQ